ncbi:uncharacterized protein LOC121371978 [Gigantopelta aegis]|uniref:uncharacterized protein LOC121371978 n=1 Tax=Gigantopelta aegis TaxID=1735272 RepID=UPI001B88E390|nr:uncharacterized protein LOC121371978 [Gigantopelta aegis]XP_041354145.1 uncharacterized protein LOC121371978 [Gigantopelta aegis]
MLLNHPPPDAEHHMPTILYRKENRPSVVAKDKKMRRDHHVYCERNLLENNLCVRLKKPYSAISRDVESREAKEIFHLTNIDDEIKPTRHKHTKRQKSTDTDMAVNARERLVSWAADAEARLPDIQQSHGHPEVSVPRETVEYTPKKDMIPYALKPREESFPKLDALGMQWISSSSVKMMKLNGVFQPVNKYEKPRQNHSSCELPLSKTIHEYETLLLPVKEKTFTKSSNRHGNADSRQKGGMRVSWTGNISRQQTDISTKSQNRKKAVKSGASQDHKEADGFGSILDQKSEDIAGSNLEHNQTEDASGKSTFLCNRTRAVTAKSSFSDKADSLCCPFKKPTYHSGKTRVKTVGVKWAIPRRGGVGGGVKRLFTQSAPLSRCTSKDLHPVTTAMNREGTSLEKTRGKVITSSCSYNTHDYWMETLKSLKSPSFGLESNLRGLMIDTARDLYVPGFDSMYVMVGESSPSL